MPSHIRLALLALSLLGFLACTGGGSTGPTVDGSVSNPAVSPTPDPTHGLFWDASPGSTLLPPGSTSIPFTVNTNQKTSCRYSVGSDLGYAGMTPFEGGQGTTSHTATFKGLNPDTTVVNDVYVRCDAAPNQVLHLRYRVLPSPAPSYPHRANLWGDWNNFKNWSPDRLGKIDLWIRSNITETNAAYLRSLNGHTLILDSTNATSPSTTIPDSYWLKDVNGKRIENWTNWWLLNLTKPEVADFLARYAYQRLLDSNLAFDGMFFDNVFLSVGTPYTDVRGNSVLIDANEDGIADDQATLNAAWRAGVLREMQTFRSLMPNAYLMGHVSDSASADVQALFDGESIGFTAAGIKDGSRTLDTLWSQYDPWWENPHSKAVTTLIESAPPFEIGYGYGFSPHSGSIPAATLEFARTYFPYVRWGLGLTLLRDGYFCHELGDTWHGQAWWYDELDADLGNPKGASYLYDWGITPTTDYVTNGGFETAITPAWALWVDTPKGISATLVQDVAQSSAGSASGKINITGTAQASTGSVSLMEKNLTTTKGISYDVSFMLKCESAQSFQVVLQKGSPDWHAYGLAKSLKYTGPGWQSFTLTFEATDTATDGRLTFNFGTQLGSIWIDDVKMVQHPPDILRRDFEKGTVLVNATQQRMTVPLNGSFKRLTGVQAPRYQYVVDDADVAFTAGNWMKASYDTGLWTATGPWFHDWGVGCHQSSSTTDTASWDLGIRADDTYTLDAWWPAAPDATNWSSAVRYDVIVNGAVVLSKTLDQTQKGDQWNRIASIALTQAAGAKVRITNLQAKPAIADAILVQSTARCNDGSDAATVELDAKDAILLLKK